MDKINISSQQNNGPFTPQFLMFAMAGSKKQELKVERSDFHLFEDNQISLVRGTSVANCIMCYKKLTDHCVVIMYLSSQY